MMKPTIPRLLRWLLLVTAGCGPTGPETKAGSARVGRVAEARAPAPGLGAALGARGFALESVLSSNGPHVAATARHRADGRLHVAVLRKGNAGYRLLGAEPLLGDLPPQRMSWPALPGPPAFAYTHDVPAEGIVATVVQAIAGDTLQAAYVDPGRVCRPAELRDLDGDGTPELISFPDEASGGDCSSECHMALRDRFHAGPHWTSVLRWTGDEWKRAEAAYPAFYADVAERYRRMEAWLAQDGACQGGKPWVRANATRFAGWAERAETLAAASR